MLRARSSLAVALPGLCLLAIACNAYTEDLLGSSANGGSGAADGGAPTAGMSNGGSGRGSNGGGGSAGQSPGLGGGGGGPGQAGGGHAGLTSGGTGAEADGGEASSGAGSGGEGGSGGGSQGGNGGSGDSGEGGSGGGEQGPLCNDHPLTTRASWIPSASHDDTGKALVSNVIDNAATRWTTGKPQSGDEWLQLDFTTAVSLNQINLQQSGTNTNDYPRSYTVIVSDTPDDLGGAVRASGAGQAGVSTAITLPDLATGRFLMIKQLGTSLSWWSAVEIEVSCVD